MITNKVIINWKRNSCYKTKDKAYVLGCGTLPDLVSFAFAHQNNIGDRKRLSHTKDSSSNHHGSSNLNRESRDYVLHLQKAIGNQAVQTLMRSSTESDFGKIGIQPKLKISQPGDAYEQEADRVAELVMRMAVPLDLEAPIVTAKDDKRIDRRCAACEMKEKEEDEEKQLKISRKPSSSITSNFEATDEIANKISTIRSNGGSPLDANTKKSMESRFGYDFSSVRIHTEERGARSADSVNALAYAVGNDIVFGEGQYQPDNLEGTRLLAHELTHVIQQPDRIFRSNTMGLRAHPDEKILNRKPDPEAERVAALKADYTFAVSSGEWKDAALILNGFNDADISSMIRKLNLSQLQSMKQGAIDAMPGWSDRVVRPIERVIAARANPEEARVSDVKVKYAATVKKQDWENAALLLNGFNDTDILLMLKGLSVADLQSIKQGALKSMPGWSERVVGPIDSLVSSKFSAEDVRVAELKANYASAVKKQDWENAALLLNGFNDDDMYALLKKLNVFQLQSIQQGANKSMPGWSHRILLKTHILIQDFVISKAGKPLSLHSTVSDDASNETIENEIMAIQKWIRDHPASSAEKNHLRDELSRLQTIVLGRLAFGIPSGKSEEISVSSMSTYKKLSEAIRLSEKYTATDRWEKVKELIEPKAIAWMVGLTSAFIVLEFTPVGWITTFLAGTLALISFSLMAPAAKSLVMHLKSFVQIATNAKSWDDLDEAGQHFSKFAESIIIDAVIAVILHRGTKWATKKVKAHIEKPGTTYREAITPDGQMIRVPVEDVPIKESPLQMEGSEKGGRGSSKENQPLPEPTGSEIPKRPLTTEDLGIKGEVKVLEGTFEVQNKTATVIVNMLEGEIKNPLQIINNLKKVARAKGASKLLIKALLANPKLNAILVRRYGLKTINGIDVIEIPIE